jgi:glycosyltransferase involved in cell wall biosynthesis
MRIGIDGRVLERNRTGVARYLVNLLHLWAEEHHAHQYYLYFEHVLPDDPLFNAPCFTRRLPLRIPLRKRNVRELVWEQTVLPAAAHLDRVDLLFSPAYTLPALFGGATAVTIHDVSYEARPEWSRLPQRWKLRTLSRMAAHRAGAVFTDSQFSKQQLLTHYRLPADKVHVIPLAADDFLRQIPTGQANALLKDTFGLKKSYLLFVGSIFPRRHIPTLMNGFELALKDGGPPMLVLVGADSLHSSFDLAKAVEALNLKLGRRAVLHLPHVTEHALQCLYKGATAFVLLSEYEGFGLTALEAMACGTPVIAARTSSIPEVLGEAAFLLEDPTDTVEVSRAILAVTTSPASRGEMIRRGLAQASRFSWRRCAQDTIRLLEQCGRPTNCRAGR